MISTQLMKLAQMNNWKTNEDEDSVFGEFNGYLFTGLEGKGYKSFITPLAGIDADSLKALLKHLEDHRKELHLRNHELTDNFLCVRMNEGLLPLKADKMAYLLVQLSGLLDLFEMPTNACVVCGEPSDRKGLYFGLFCHLHPDCQNQEPVDYTSSEEPGDEEV